MYPISPEVYYQEYDKQVAAALLRQTGKAKTELADCGRVPWPKAGGRDLAVCSAGSGRAAYPRGGIDFARVSSKMRPWHIVSGVFIPQSSRTLIPQLNYRKLVHLHHEMRRVPW